MTAIATINIENIIPVIIVFGVIISKIMQGIASMKKVNPAQNDKSAEKDPEYRAAPNELRNFLETLTGMPQEIKAPTVAAPPLPPQQAVKTKRTTHYKRDKSPLPPVVTQTATPVKPVKKKTEYHNHTKSANFHWNNGMRQKQILISPAEIANDLISRKSLAKAILLKEILDKPVALREG